MGKIVVALTLADLPGGLQVVDCEIEGQRLTVDSLVKAFERALKTLTEGLDEAVIELDDLSN
jgi:hypothetical protein